MHVDLDGVLFDEREEYEWPSSASNDSSENVNCNGVLESMNDFE